MKGVARQPVSRRETLDLSAQRVFLPLQPLELRFAAANSAKYLRTTAETEVSNSAARMRALR